MFKRKTVVTFEKLERCRYIVADAELVMTICDRCGRVVSWLTPNQIAAVTGLTLRELFRRIEAGAVHFNEAGNGLLLICADSVANTHQDRL